MTQGDEWGARVTTPEKKRQGFIRVYWLLMYEISSLHHRLNRPMCLSELHGFFFFFYLFGKLRQTQYQIKKKQENKKLSILDYAT